MSTFRTRREEIIAAMRNALDGMESTLSNGPLAGADWLVLDQDEKSALLQLQNWKQDEPLRCAFPRHAEYSSKRMEHLINILG